MRRLAAALFVLVLAATTAAAQEPQGWAYKNIVSATTTTLKSKPGYLHSICINTPSVSATVTVYDNTAASGTKIGTLTSFASLPGCFTYDVSFWLGLMIVTSSASTDVTVSFR
jgi:hypothetical protein